MFFTPSPINQNSILVSCIVSITDISDSILFSVLVFVTLPIRIESYRSEIEYLLDILISSGFSKFNYSISSVPSGLHIKGHSNSVCSKLLHDRMWKVSHIQRNLWMLKTSKVPTFISKKMFDDSFTIRFFSTA